MGFGEVYDVVVEILNNIDCYLYVVCGSNEKLKEKLTDERRGKKIRNPGSGS